MNETLLRLVRPELRGLVPYAAASAERELIRLHANEAPAANGRGMLNRYPEPQPRELIGRLSALYDVNAENILATRGSDDAIDLLVRCFCRAGQDKVAICPPAFGMYEIAARLQNAGVVRVPLVTDRFALDVAAIESACKDDVRIVFLCSPNNPTGNVIAAADIQRLCRSLRESALVVVDEAYIEFAARPSVTTLLDDFPNLVVLRTLSKAYALAGARVGALIAHRDLLALVRPAMPPYPLPTPAVDAAIAALEENNLRIARDRIADTCALREPLRLQLEGLRIVRRTWPSEGNFILAEVRDSSDAVAACRSGGVLIRDMSAQPGLANHVRITVGTVSQNRLLRAALEGLR